MRLFRTLLPVALGLAALVNAARADRADLIVPIGTPANSQIAAPGDFVTVGFLVTEGVGRKVSITVKRNGKTSKLVPEVKLIDPDGLTFDIATAPKGKVSKPGATTYAGSFPDVTKSGLWRFEVRGGAGSVGAFSATVKATDTTKFASSKTSPPTVQVNGKAEFRFTAGENMALTVTGKRVTGSGVVLQLTVLDKNGLAIAPAAVATAKGALSLKGLRLPTFGEYTLRFTGGQTGGGFSYAASTAAVKFKKTPLPTAVAKPTSSEPLLPTTLDGTGSAPSGGGVITYRWMQVSGPSVVLANPDTLMPTFTAPSAAATLAFQLSVTESGTLLSKPATVAVEVAKRPVADAGRAANVAASAAGTLDASGSLDRRGKGLKFAWRQMPGDASTVTLAGATTVSPTFTAPAAPTVLHFGLTVDDGVIRSFEDVVVVNVGDATKHVADAGREQYVPRMASVHLSGLASIAPSGVLDGAAAWTKVSGPAVTLAGADTLWPSFTAPKFAADYVFKLTVDGNDAAADTVAVHVRTDETNLPPPARGNGPLSVGPGDVTLRADLPAPNGTVDPNNDSIRYRWAQVGGAPLSLANARTQQAIVTMVAGNGEYQFCLHANDGLQYGSIDFVNVRSVGFSGRPIAVAGAERTVAGRGAPVSLDGRASSRTDGGTDPLTFQWTQVSGKDWFDFAANSPAFNPAVAQPVVTLPADVSSLTAVRTVLFRLVVNDGANVSAPDYVSVTYNDLVQNGLPTVTGVADDANPIAGQLVTLQGTAFDRDGDPMTFTWTQKQGPTVTFSPSNKVLSPTFIVPATTTPLKFEVVANDGVSDGPVSPQITVAVNQPPVANIVVSPLNGPPGTIVTMDGANATNSSSDAETPTPSLTFSWRQISGPTISLPNPATTTAITFTYPLGSTIPVVIGLKVNDGRQFSTERTASFSPNLPPSVAPSASGIDTTYMPTISGVAGYAAYGATVSLQANGSGGTGPLTYLWTLDSQTPAVGVMPAIVFSNASSPNPTFVVQPPTSASPFGWNPWPEVTVGVTATDGSQTSPKQQLKIRFFASFSNGQYQTQATWTAANAPGAQTVYGIITSSCTSCHGGTGAGCPGASGSGMGYGASGGTNYFLNNSRGVNSCSAATFRLPSQGSTGQSASSNVLQRLKNNPGPVMPQGQALPAATINLIQDWIDQGARSN